MTPSEREINKNNAVVNSFSATAHALARHDGHSNLTSCSSRSSPGLRSLRDPISMCSPTNFCFVRRIRMPKTNFLHCNAGLGLDSASSLPTLCRVSLPACLLGRLSVCRGRVASETYAKLLTQKATKRNANTTRTVRKARRSEEKQRKSCRLRLCRCLCLC